MTRAPETAAITVALAELAERPATDWPDELRVRFPEDDALARQAPAFTCRVVETEFWGAMATPNLMVESSIDDLADMMTALSFHVGEVQRNPYHLLVPAWMQDNVRRGAELVGGQGGAAPDFDFCTLYRLREWRDGGLHVVHDGGRALPASVNVRDILAIAARP